MHWEFANYPSVWRARTLARQAGLSGEPATHVLYGLLRLAEESDQVCELSSDQVLEYLRRLPARNFISAKLPEVTYLPGFLESLGRPWIRLFEHGNLGWRMCLAVGIEPNMVLSLNQQAESWALRRYSSQIEPTFWVSDLAVLVDLLVDGALVPVFGERAAAALEWLENEQSDLGLHALAPGNPAPEPPLTDLLAILARTPTVSEVFWYCGRSAPQYLENPGHRERILTASRNPVFVPGRSAASAAGHREIHPIHQFLAGLSEPRYQADFGPISRTVRDYLQEIPIGFGGRQFSKAALDLLRWLAELCLGLNIAPSPIHVTWAAFKNPDQLLRRALDRLDVARFESTLEAELFGRLPEQQMEVDGLRLGASGVEMGPLSKLEQSQWLTEQGSIVTLDESGRINEIQGRRLGSAGRTLLDRGSRPSEFERLLGLGRTNRWTPVYGGVWLKVETDQGILESVGLAL